MAVGTTPERTAVLAWARNQIPTAPTTPKEDTAITFLRYDPYFYRRPDPPPDLKFLAKNVMLPQRRRR